MTSAAPARDPLTDEETMQLSPPRLSTKRQTHAVSTLARVPVPKSHCRLSSPAALACVLLLACGQSGSSVPGPAAPTYPLRIQAQGNAQGPLAGVRITREGVLLGTTDTQGGVQLALEGTEGDRTPLQVICPEGFVSPEAPIVVGLRHLKPGSPAPTFEVECVPLLHTFVIGLRSEHGAHLPVAHLGKTLGETDEFGVAHVLVRAPRQEQVSLTLDTSGHPELRPQNPSLTFVAPDRDELILFEQEFVELRRAPPPPRRPRGPIAL
jgi:hypothetical protein